MLNVLSLFDGISCARLALNKNGTPIGKYFASEIDKDSISVTKHHFPDTIFLGDVRHITKDSLGGVEIDLLIGGSPCQDLSNAQVGQGLQGVKSSLFYEYLRLLQELKPKYFLLENVSMKKDWKNIFDHTLGVKGIEINSNIFSAQSRPRCYWTNIDFDDFPTELSNTNMIDILEHDLNTDRYDLKPKEMSAFLKQNSVDEHQILSMKNAMTDTGIVKLFDIPKDILKESERQRRVYSVHGKSPTLLARADTTKILIGGKVRKLTPLECERLQKVPDHYTNMCSNTKRYMMVGNGFTVDVIAHFLKNVKIESD
jgi:DNA-cytosine methyltransferase